MSAVKKKNLRVLTALIPLAISVIAVCTRAFWMAPLAAAAMFLIVAAVPVFRIHANLWIFMFTGIAGIPWNILLCRLLIPILSESRFFFQDLLWGVVLFFVLFSVEQIVFCVITRMLFRNQTYI